MVFLGRRSYQGDVEEQEEDQAKPFLSPDAI